LRASDAALKVKVALRFARFVGSRRIRLASHFDEKVDFYATVRHRSQAFIYD
jgi:hypothetical protein